MGWGEGHDKDDRAPNVVNVFNAPDNSRLETRLDEIDRKLGVLIRGLRHIDTEEQDEMSEIDDLRAGQAQLAQGLSDLGVAAGNAATRIQAKLDELVAAEGNSVTAADVTGIQDDVSALADISSQVATLSALGADPAPVTPPPVDQPPVDVPPVDVPPVDTPPVDVPPVDQPPVDVPPVATPPSDTPA